MIAKSRTWVAEKITLQQMVGTGSYPAAKEWICALRVPASQNTKPDQKDKT
jgi:hypothetical protein